MEEILHQLIGSLSHYLQGFLHPRWCRISSMNSRKGPFIVEIGLIFLYEEIPMKFRGKNNFPRLQPQLLKLDLSLGCSWHKKIPLKQWSQSSSDSFEKPTQSSKKTQRKKWLELGFKNLHQIRIWFFSNSTCKKICKTIEIFEEIKFTTLNYRILSTHHTADFGFCERVSKSLECIKQTCYHVRPVFPLDFTLLKISPRF